MTDVFFGLSHPIRSRECSPATWVAAITTQGDPRVENFAQGEDDTRLADLKHSLSHFTA